MMEWGRSFDSGKLSLAGRRGDGKCEVHVRKSDIHVVCSARFAKKKDPDMRVGVSLIYDGLRVSAWLLLSYQCEHRPDGLGFSVG